MKTDSFEINPEYIPLHTAILKYMREIENNNNNNYDTCQNIISDIKSRKLDNNEYRRKLLQILFLADRDELRAKVVDMLPEDQSFIEKKRDYPRMLDETRLAYVPNFERFFTKHINSLKKRNLKFLAPNSLKFEYRYKNLEDNIFRGDDVIKSLIKMRENTRIGYVSSEDIFPPLISLCQQSMFKTNFNVSILGNFKKDNGNVVKPVDVTTSILFATPENVQRYCNSNFR